MSISPSTPADASAQSNLRRVDQMITMHSGLRDRAERRSRNLTVGILAASVISVALAFSGSEEIVNFLGIEASSSTWLGWLGVFVFIASLIELTLNLRGVADKHATAVGKLAELKMEYRRTLQSPVTQASQPSEYLNQRYSDTMSSITPIPEAHFNGLKAEHLKKVEISKILSAYPGETVRGAKKRLKQRLASQTSRTEAERD